MKEPVFIRALGQKFIFFDPLKKNLPEAETERCSFMIGFMSLEFLRIFKNSRHLIRSLHWHKHQIFKQEF